MESNEKEIVKWNKKDFYIDKKWHHYVYKKNKYAQIVEGFPVLVA